MDNKKEHLLICAEKIFKQLGYKRTKVSDITNEAGLAAGTFYNYFDSKDEIFMTIYSQENVHLKKEILKKVNMTDHPGVVMTQMMVLNDEAMKNNPILKEWFNPDVAIKLERAFKKYDGLSAMTFMYHEFMTVIEAWQQNGKLRRDIEAEVIMTMFSSLIVLETHKETIGVDHFDAAMQWMSSFILDGLLKEKK